tara:strand:+ start:91859 stop:92719 length:861 start_codon:yes stop_codon:yes gene_type:complete
MFNRRFSLVCATLSLCFSVSAWSANSCRGLFVRSVDQMVDHIVNPHTEFFSSSDLSDMRQLKGKDKAYVLERLGRYYSAQKGKVINAAIQIIMDPMAIYREFQKSGGEAKDFYPYYLKVLREQVFKGSRTTGQYDASVIFSILEPLQEFIRRSPKVDSVVFFGSVPNGFGRVGSDLDIFNVARPEGYPHLKEQIEDAVNSMGRIPDPLEPYRYPIADTMLNQQVGVILQNLPFRWATTYTTDRAHEHFGSQSHPFTFVVSSTSIELRMYDMIHRSPDYSHYIVLPF